MGEKTKKVRTSITIDPGVLARIRVIAEDPESDYKSVAAFIERACLALLGPDERPTYVGDDTSDAGSTGQEFD